MRTVLAIASTLFLALSLSACAPEVGTEAWCEDMEDTPKGDWSANDAKAFGQYCMFDNFKDKED
jgi:hypothetical protein